MAKRSPILGFNHNVRHRGLLFHLQTEDSGVDNPHIYTNLFHGGVIISSRKLQYDRESAEDVVKSLMQAQHKAALRELKAGSFDEKISLSLQDHPDLEPTGRRAGGHVAFDPVSPPPPQPLAASSPPSPVTRPLGPVMTSSDPGHPTEPSRRSRSDSDVSAAFLAIKRESTEEPAADAPPAAAGKGRAAQNSYALHRTGQLEIMPELPDQSSSTGPRGKGRVPRVVSPVAPRPPAGTSRPAGKPHAAAAGAARPAGKPPPVPATAVPVGPPPRAGVVVSRPSIVVGSPPRIVSPREPGAEPLVPRNIRLAREKSAGPSLFGKDLISERSLDEVILAYLSDDTTEK